MRCSDFCHMPCLFLCCVHMIVCVINIKSLREGICCLPMYFSIEVNNAQSSEFFDGRFSHMFIWTRHSVQIIFGHYTKYIRTWGLYSELQTEGKFSCSFPPQLEPYFQRYICSGDVAIARNYNLLSYPYTH